MFVLKTDFKIFCKGYTWNSKTAESLKVILTILEQKWFELLRESVSLYGTEVLHGSLSNIKFVL